MQHVVSSLSICCVTPMFWQKLRANQETRRQFSINPTRKPQLFHVDAPPVRACHREPVPPSTRLRARVSIGHDAREKSALGLICGKNLNPNGQAIASTPHTRSRHSSDSSPGVTSPPTPQTNHCRYTEDVVEKGRRSEMETGHACRKGPTMPKITLCIRWPTGPGRSAAG